MSAVSSSRKFDQELGGLVDAHGRQRDELGRALCALVSDFEAMQAPLRNDEADPARHDAQRADAFGPFASHYDERDQTMREGEAVRLCWPNARISLDEAKKVLRALV